MASQDSTIYDELLECLNDRMFQIPVKSFMDENCLIFDPSIEVSPDHFALFTSYQELVKDLLNDFCQSKRVSFGEIHEGVMRLYTEPDLCEVFGASFEQMLSSADFDIFRLTMANHNIVIQEQVLQMILASTGIIPESFTSARTIPDDSTSKPPSQSKLTRDKMDRKEKKEKVNDIDSKKEREIEEQKKLLEQEMRLLAHDSASATKSEKSGAQVQTIAKSSGKSSSADAKMSSSEAAQKWMKEANEETGSHRDEGEAATTDGRRKIGPSDMKQRQQFLRDQRDKIIAMRREAREKQLDPETKITPKDSATGRKPVTTSPASSESADREKMLAKRRALAAKLRQEVVDKQ